MTDISTPAPKTYRWAFYILLVILGYWIGASKSHKDLWFYLGPDPNKQEAAWIGILTTGDKP